MKEENLQITEIEGKKYYVVDTLSHKGNTYHFLAGLENKEDLCVLKEKIEDGEKFFVSIEDDKELDDALVLFYEKYGEPENTN